MRWEKKKKRSTSKKKKIQKMEPTNLAGKNNEDGPTLLQTGLFVSWDRIRLLLSIVEDMLRVRYHMTAESGPRRDNGTCEIILRPLQSSGANFAASKAILKNYLDLIQESSPNCFLEKQVEVINLVEEEDEESLVVLDKSMDGTIPIIDLDGSVAVQCNQSSSERSCMVQDSGNSNRSMNYDCKNIPVVDLQNETISPGFKSQFENDNRNVFKEPNYLSRKRKFPFESEDVENSDDDVVILEESFLPSNPILSKQKCTNDDNISQSSSNIKVKIVGGIRHVKEYTSEETDPLKVAVNTTNNKTSTVNSSTGTTYGCDFLADCVSAKIKIKESQNNNHSVVNTNSKSTSSKRHKRVLKKLTYKRPAHLIQPLTNKISNDVPKVGMDSVSNIYNPDPGASDKRTGLRPIVIDGNNIAVSHGKGQFSVKGIQICVNYFEKRGHRQIKAFIPHYRINKETHNDLVKMEREGTVVLTPSRKVEGKTVASYDDRYIVQYASEFGGVIISTDNYRDLMAENPSWRETIEKRLLMFTWVDDLLMFPQDPLGRRGPSLEDFLKFPD